MVRKLLSALLVVLLALLGVSAYFTFFGKRNAEPERTAEPEVTAVPEDPAPTPTPEPHSAVLVVYFSRTGEQSSVGVIDKGNTEIVAEMIAEKNNADLFQILPEVDNYPMTYRALTDVAKQEQDAKARPAYAGEVNDLAGYETIFIGAPVWRLAY